MRKRIRIVVIVMLLFLLGVVLYVMNAIFGNPISKKIAEHAAKEYINENYAGQNLKVDEVSYNFKVSQYIAYIVSETSMDTHFTVDMTWNGKVEDDTYDDVTSGRNTYYRLEEEYRDLVNTLFDNPEFPLKSEIDFGDLKLFEKSVDDYDDIEYGIELSTLELDKQYDIKDLAKTAGQIVFYASDKEVSYKKASELMLQLKDELDQAGVPFYAINFVLEEATEEEKPGALDGPRIEVDDFLYSDLYQDGLEERVKEADERLAAYYEKQDALYKKNE